MKLTNKELKDIKAGASIAWIVGLVAAGITFLSGVLDGYFRPFKCR